MKTTLFLIVSLMSCSVTARDLTLNEAIALAQAGSVQAAVARGNLRAAYWSWRSYRANLLPEVTLDATLPNYNRRYSTYQNSDGSFTYVRSDHIGLNGSLNISQPIWLTGGQVQITSSLDYIHQFGGEHRYMSVPLSFIVSQPLFAANSYKWNRRIEPVRYKEAKANFVTATEQVTMATITYFFNLLQAREQVHTAQQTLANARRLYEVAQARRKMGQLSENDLLQMEYNVLTAEASLTAKESTMRSCMFSLRSHLDIDDDIDPVLPESLPPLMLDYAQVLDKALEHNSHALNIRRRQLEADYEVAQARGNLRSVTLYASVGLTATGQEMPEAYRRLVDNHVAKVGASIPLLDWGKRRGRVRVAQSNREVVQSRLRQETADFKQDLFVLVEKFNNQQRQLQLALQADTIAARRYATNVETFAMGRISTLDLGDSQTSRDAAHQNYVSQLYYYWYYYYQLRSITLWDWLHGTGIDADIEAVIRRR